jgi:hypothetical protein
MVLLMAQGLQASAMVRSADGYADTSGPTKHSDSATSPGSSPLHYPVKLLKLRYLAVRFILLEIKGSSMALARFRHVSPLLQPLLLGLREG